MVGQHQRVAGAGEPLREGRGDAEFLRVTGQQRAGRAELGAHPQALVVVARAGRQRRRGDDEAGPRRDPRAGGHEVDRCAVCGEQRRQRAGGELLRHQRADDVDALEQQRHGVVVVGIGVGDDEQIEAAARQRVRDLLGGATRRLHAAAVDGDAAALGVAEQAGLAMADGGQQQERLRRFRARQEVRRHQQRGGGRDAAATGPSAQRRDRAEAGRDHRPRRRRAQRRQRRPRQRVGGVHRGQVQLGGRGKRRRADGGGRWGAQAEQRESESADQQHGDERRQQRRQQHGPRRQLPEEPQRQRRGRQRRPGRRRQWRPQPAPQRSGVGRRRRGEQQACDRGVAEQEARAGQFRRRRERGDERWRQQHGSRAAWPTEAHGPRGERVAEDRAQHRRFATGHERISEQQHEQRGGADAAGEDAAAAARSAEAEQQSEHRRVRAADREQVAQSGAAMRRLRRVGRPCVAAEHEAGDQRPRFTGQQRQQLRLQRAPCRGAQARQRERAGHDARGRRDAAQRRRQARSDRRRRVTEQFDRVAGQRGHVVVERDPQAAAVQQRAAERRGAHDAVDAADDAHEPRLRRRRGRRRRRGGGEEGGQRDEADAARRRRGARADEAADAGHQRAGGEVPTPRHCGGARPCAACDQRPR